MAEENDICHLETFSLPEQSNKLNMTRNILYLYLFIYIWFSSKRNKHRQFYDASGRFQMPLLKLIKVGHFFKISTKARLRL